MSKPETETDDEARAYQLLVESKKVVLTMLAAIASDRRARGECVEGVIDSIAYEELTLAGYQRALDSRRKQLRTRGKR